MAENEAFFDEEEGIGWGPLTLKEVKAFLKQKRPKSAISARHSTYIPKNIKSVEKMEKVEKDSVPEISDYLTASEQLHDGSFVSAVDPTSSYPENTETCVNFIQIGLENTTSDLIESEYQSLVDITQSCNTSFDTKNCSIISISSEDELEKPTKDLSSEDEMEETEKESPNKFNLKKRQLGCLFGESSSFSEKDTGREEEIFDIPSIRVEDISNIDIDVSNNDSTNISAPEIDFHQFDDSDESILNNTLEKINAILKLTEEKEEDTTSEDSFVLGKRTLHQESSIRNKSSIMSASFLHKPDETNELAAPILQTETVIKKYKTPIKSNIPILKKSPELFKVPNFPHKQKVPNTKLDLKNIVSPVRMYIKYSPQAVLKQNIHCEGNRKLHLSQKCLETKHKENIAEIPSNIAYKPSKKQILATEESFKFPESLDKMIKKSAAIKHERTPTVQSNETLDHEANLTCSLLSETLSEIDNNVSILHKRKALRK